MISAASTPRPRASCTADQSPSITAEKGTPRLVWACGSKKISARTTPSAAARSKYAMAKS